MALKNTIIEYLKSKDTWVHKGELGKKAVVDWGYENENMGRRCRELENEGKIERKLIKNPKTGVWEAWYRYQNTPLTQNLPHRTIIHSCCYSFTKFKTHAPNCQILCKNTLKIPQEPVLF